MSDKIEDGWPAFPKDVTAGGYRGMSMRDYAAIKFAAAGFASATNIGACSKEERRELFDLMAEITYEAADAMLAARRG